MSAHERKLRWGVLGFARIAKNEVIPAIKRSSNGQFFAIASRDEAKLKACRETFGVDRAFLDYSEMIGDPEVDAVYIPLPNSQHREWAIRAIKAGKHVLCEKPIGLNASECREMIAAAGECGVLLMEAFMYRYSERTRKVVETLASGALGHVRHVNSTFRFLLANPSSIKLQRDLGGGSFYDVGCYPLNFAGLVADLMGDGPGTSRPEAVVAQAVVEQGIDIQCSAILRYPTGMVASLNCGFNAHKRVFSEIVGSKGLLEIPDTFFGNAGSMLLTTDSGTREIPVGESDRYRLEVEDFARAVLEKREPHFPLKETQRNMEVMDWVHREAGVGIASKL